MSFQVKETYEFEDLLAIMALLRSPGGCPWDGEQTHQSIRKNFLEETYEVLDAIDSRDDTALQEELGDVLLQVVFHARMAEERDAFSMDDCIDGIVKKLVFRHPHLFAQATADKASDALDNWEALKNREKGQETLQDKLDAVPQVFPALMRGQKLCKRAMKGGAMPSDPAASAQDADKAFRDYQQSPSDPAALGRLLFALCRQAQSADVDAEEALDMVNRQFTRKGGSLE